MQGGGDRGVWGGGQLRWRVVLQVAVEPTTTTVRGACCGETTVRGARLLLHRVHQLPVVAAEERVEQLLACRLHILSRVLHRASLENQIERSLVTGKRFKNTGRSPVRGFPAHLRLHHCLLLVVAARPRAFGREQSQSGFGATWATMTFFCSF